MSLDTRSSVPSVGTATRFARAAFLAPLIAVPDIVPVAPGPS